MDTSEDIQPTQRFFAPAEDGTDMEVDEETFKAMMLENRLMEEESEEEEIREENISRVDAAHVEMRKNQAVEDATGYPKDTVDFVLSGGKRTEEQAERNWVERSPQSEDEILSLFQPEDIEPSAVIDSLNEEINENQEEQLSQYMLALLPENMSDEELEAYQNFVRTGELPDEFSDEMLHVFKKLDDAKAPATAKHRRKSDRLRAMIGDDITLEDAQRFKENWKEFYRSERGWLERLGHKISIPMEALTRSAVVGLEEYDLISTEQAKDFLSHDALYPSDIIHFYIDNFNSEVGGVQRYEEREAAGEVAFGERLGRMATGLVSDIFLDPITYLTGGLSAVAKTANVLGKSFKNLGKVGKAERAWIRTADKVEKIIGTDGAIKNVAAAEKNLGALRDGKISIQDFNINVGATPKARKAIREASKVELTDMTAGEKWASGYHNLKIGARIPFTNAAAEVAIGVPSGTAMGATIGFLGAGPIGAGVGGAIGAGLSYGAIPRTLSAGLQLGKRGLLATEGGVKIAAAAASFATKTGKHVFDDALFRYHGDLAYKEKELTLIEEKQRHFFKHLEKKIGNKEEFERVVRASLDEMELKPYSWDEVVASGEQDITKIAKMLKDSPEDVARSELLAKHGLTEKIQELRNLYEEGAVLFKERGIPFTPLRDPKSPLHARRYAKHMLNKQFLKKLQERNRTSDEVGGVLDYLAESNPNILSRSERGRKYLGTINAQNEISMKELGVKTFVDDPIELAIARNKEMVRIAKLHDMFKAAENYAVKSPIPPGQEFVKFDFNQFSSFLLENVDEIGDARQIEKTIKSYLPKFYSESSSIYLPYDVYDRLIYMAKGDDLLKANPLFDMYSGFMSIFVKNALAGLAYQTINTVGNTMQYMTANGVGGLTGMARAAALMMSPKAYDKIFGNAITGIKVVGEDGVSRVLKGEELLEEALRGNLFNSGSSQELKFGQLVDGVASNRAHSHTWITPFKKTEQILTTKKATKAGEAARLSAVTIGEAATLWRLNRWVAEKMDTFPKIGTYLDRRSRGFSPQASAELADRYFYSFNIAGQNQNRLARTVPFSRFAFKTLENTLEQIKNHELADVILPDKVRRAMVGDYVDDPENREWLNQNLPAYHVINSPTWGTMFPGNRSVMRSYPWSVNTLNMFFNPAEDVNPAAKMIGSAYSWAVSRNDEDMEDYAADMFAKDIGETLKLLIPPNILAWAQYHDLKNELFGGVLANQFKPYLPTEAEFGAAAGKPPVDSPKVTMYNNALEFGEMFVDNYLYQKLWGDDRDQFHNVSTKDQRIAARGEFIRLKMRQFLFGQATMTKVDQNFFFRQAALKRERNRLESKIMKRMNAMEGSLNVGDMLHKTKNGDLKAEDVAQKMPEIYSLLKLESFLDANRDGYNMYSQYQIEKPDLDLGELLFGLSDNMIDKWGNIDYEKLTAKESDFSAISAADKAMQIKGKIKSNKESVDTQQSDKQYKEEDFGDDLIDMFGDF